MKKVIFSLVMLAAAGAASALPTGPKCPNICPPQESSQSEPGSAEAEAEAWAEELAMDAEAA